MWPSSNVDIVYRILIHLPDFKSLATAILTCSGIYRVYSTHPTSVRRAIAYNLVGSALPQALRLVRCERQGLRLRPLHELLGEDELRKNPWLSNDEIRDLCRLATNSQELEDIFSWRCRLLQIFIYTAYKLFLIERKTTSLAPAASRLQSRFAFGAPYLEHACSRQYME